MYRDLGSANVVSIAIAFAVGYFFLEPPWRWLILIPAIVIESLDIIVWLRWRKKRALAGADTMIGMKGTVVEVEPDRIMVKAKGQLWRAEATATVRVGDHVAIDEVHGIRLKVSPTEVDTPKAVKPPS